MIKALADGCTSLLLRVFILYTLSFDRFHVVSASLERATDMLYGTHGEKKLFALIIYTSSCWVVPGQSTAKFRNPGPGR